MILLAIFSVLQGIYFQLNRNDTQACIEDKFRELSVALDVRAELVTQESRAIRQVLLSAASGAGEETTPEQARRAREKLGKDLLNYRQVAKDVDRQRQEHPVPPYPVGACDVERSS